MQKREAMGWQLGVAGVGGSSISITPSLVSSPEEGQAGAFYNGWMSPVC